MCDFRSIHRKIAYFFYNSSIVLVVHKSIQQQVVRNYRKKLIKVLKGKKQKIVFKIPIEFAHELLILYLNLFMFTM